SDRRCGTVAGLDPSEKGPQPALTVVQRPRPQPQGTLGSAGSPPNAPAQDLPAADLVLRTQPEPTTKMFDRRPTAHVGADLTQQHQRRRLLNPLDGRQVDSAHAIQPGPGIKTRLIGLAPASVPPLRQRLAPALIGEGPQMGFDGSIAGRDLLVVKFVEGDRLLQSEQMLLPPVTLQRPRNGRRTLLATGVAQPGQLCGRPFAPHNRLEDRHTRNS